MVPCADFTQGMEKKEIIRKLKLHAPLLFDVMMTDLGCEFSAVSKDERAGHNQIPPNYFSKQLIVVNLSLIPPTF